MAKIRILDDVFMDKHELEEAIMQYLVTHHKADYDVIAEDGLNIAISDYVTNVCISTQENMGIWVKFPRMVERFVRSELWDCGTSGMKCCYDNQYDPSHDNCLFCRQPEERK